MRAMILAAGRGERMRPLTDTTPKPLLRVAGKPLIVWHIERLVAAGIHDIIINHAWLGEQIEHVLGSGDKFGARLSYSPEPTALETAGGIAKVLPFFQNQPFLVVNGDVWCDWNPALATSCTHVLQETNSLAWLLMVDNPEHNPDGDFLLDTSPEHKSTGTSFVPVRVPTGDQQPASMPPQSLTFAGIGIYHPCFFSDVVPDTPAALAPLLRTAIQDNRIIGSRHVGEWIDVGTPERLYRLDRRLAMPGHARYTSTDF